jgi:GntR family transcriptional regulator/MocR family aminotransferase
MQAACATFLSNGDLDRHLRRTRRIYRERRDALVDAIGQWLPDGTISGIAAGLHVLVTLPDTYDEAVITQRSLERGVRVYPLSMYRGRRSAALPPGFVLGYGRLAPAASDAGVRLLAEVVTSSR